MQRRYVRLTRALSAAGLLALLAIPVTVRADDRAGAAAPDAPTAASDAVSILDAARSGLIAVEARGAGEDHVHLTLQNRSTRPLRVVIPAGLVAASGTAQFGGGFQSMGLGTPTSHAGSFGQFQAAAPGFQSVPASGAPSDGIDLDLNATAELDLPSVCLNYGVATPTPKNRFQLVDVDDYTTDPRARKALRSLATLGTSQRVAQAVAWNVFNGMGFDQMQMATRTARFFNVQELALASRFVQALDATADDTLVQAEQLAANRMFVRLRGAEKGMDLAPITQNLGGERILGLPVQVTDQAPTRPDVQAALLLDVAVTSQTPSLLKGKTTVRYRTPTGAWVVLGQTEFETHPEGATAEGLADALDRAIAEDFVRVRTAKKGTGTTTVTLENRLPMTLASAQFRSGKPESSGVVPVEGLGLSPARKATITLPTDLPRIERVTLNGL